MPTASERLRALAKEAAGFEFVPVNPSDLGYVQRNEPEEILTDALPLIADVVEAAEELEEDSLYETWLAREAKVRRALLALEEHLDGGEE